MSDPLFVMKEIISCGKNNTKYINDWKQNKYKNLDVTEKTSDSTKSIRVYTSRGRLVGSIFFSLFNKVNNMR